MLQEAYCKGLSSAHYSAHSPMIEEPEKFLKIIREDVLAGKTGHADIN